MENPWASLVIQPPVEPCVEVEMELSHGQWLGEPPLHVLQGLQPPFQTGPHKWPARLCAWNASPKDLDELFTQQPKLVYSIGRPRAPTERRAWHALKQQLQQPTGNPGQQQEAAAAAAVAPGRTQNALLLHVAGRHSDTSIYMLLVPRLESPGSAEDASRIVLWSYFPLLQFSWNQLMHMHQHPGSAALQLSDVLKALTRPSRQHDKNWAACVEYQRIYGQRPDGLPQYCSGVTICPHLLEATPASLLDIVDRNYLSGSSGCCGAGGSSGGGAARPEQLDACACRQQEHVFAGCITQQPMHVGLSREEFAQPCRCPPELWCEGSVGRQQVLQLWQHSLPLRLEIKPSSKGGLGLYAGQLLPESTSVGEYCGELITLKEAERRQRVYGSCNPALFYIWEEDISVSVSPYLAIHREKVKRDLLQQQQAAQHTTAEAAATGPPLKKQARNKGDNQQQPQQQPQQPQQPQQQHTARRKRPACEQENQQPMAIDATFVGGITRFINHSCDPNCKPVMVCTDGCEGVGEAAGAEAGAGAGTMVILIRTIREVQEGEELTFDYSPPPARDTVKAAWDRKGKIPGFMKCVCGARTCRGVV